MSRRVTVVLSQGHRLGAERQYREDELVAELLMSSEAEATIVADLKRIEPGGTDQLCLESIAGTAVLLAWYDVETAAAELDRIGVAAKLLNHASNEGTAQNGNAGAARELYYYDLNAPEKPEFYLDVISRVADEVDRAPVGLTNLASGDLLPVLAMEPAQPVAEPQVSQTVELNVAEDDEAEERDDLDDLMDELDRVEL
ncbi:MAG: hypothetical protein MI757_11495 [Pirellulales bacterium]|nr:hypothetical protein [Pirellulales bacterium]